jgi:hypothetical protein
MIINLTKDEINSKRIIKNLQKERDSNLYEFESLIRECKCEEVKIECARKKIKKNLNMKKKVQENRISKQNENLI